MQTVGQGPAREHADRGNPRLAVALVALVVALAAIALSLGGRDALPSNPELWTPLQTAERFNELYETGRVDEFQALVSADALSCVNASCSITTTFFGSEYGHAIQTAFESQYLAATGGTLGAECTAEGPDVTCEWHQSNLFFEVGDIDPWVGPQSFTVESGRITRYSGGYRYEGVFVGDRVQQNQYSDWLEIHYPAEYPTLFEDQLMLVFTEHNRDRHRELIAVWADELRS